MIVITKHERKLTMKKVIASIVLLFAVSSAIAACPTYAPYRCVQGYNGKMVCGCGV